MKPFVIITALTCLVPLSSRATLVAYWDMDASTPAAKLPATSGTQAGSLSNSFVNLAIGFSSRIDPLVTGTLENIVGSSPTNRAVGFYRVGTAYESGAFEMSGFDFTGLSDVSISFAYRSFDTFTWDSNLEVDYRIGAGSWIDFAEAETWTSGYTLAEIDFGSLLDNQASVDFRIRTENWSSAFGYLDLDNIQVNAVPEPRAAALGAGILAVVAGWIRLRARRLRR